MHKMYLRGCASAAISALISQKSEIFDSFSQEKPLRPVGAVALKGRPFSIHKQNNKRRFEKHKQYEGAARSVRLHLLNM